MHSLLPWAAARQSIREPERPGQIPHETNGPDSDHRCTRRRHCHRGILEDRGWRLQRSGRTDSKFAARAARRLAVPENVKSRQNPTVNSAEVLSDARAHWADHCATCHANNGSGDAEMGRNMYPRAPDMRQASTPESLRWRAVLHYRERYSLDWDARLGQRFQQIGRRLVETRALPSVIYPRFPKRRTGR